MIPSIKQKALT